MWKCIFMKKNHNNNNYDEHSASFATRQFSTLNTFSHHLEDIVSHKNTQYQKVCVYLNLSVYISRDFSSLVAIEMYGRPFLFGTIPIHREYYRTL